jgi:soluble lytic murein transglycosylase-like protein
MQAIGRRAPVAPEIEALIADKANKHGVPLPLAHAVVRIESNYNPRAVGGRALGLMQIKHATARGIGFTGSAEQLFDPAVNLEWGMRYLAGARRLARGDLCGTIMRYQSGHRAERMNRANVAYCARVRHLMAHAPRERQQLADRSTRR